MLARVGLVLPFGSQPVTPPPPPHALRSRSRHPCCHRAGVDGRQGRCWLLTPAPRSADSFLYAGPPIWRLTVRMLVPGWRALSSSRCVQLPWQILSALFLAPTSGQAGVDAMLLEGVVLTAALYLAVPPCEIWTMISGKLKSVSGALKSASRIPSRIPFLIAPDSPSQIPLSPASDVSLPANGGDPPGHGR